MQLSEIQLKRLMPDFQVREIAHVNYGPNIPGRYHYYLLRKVGLTTFEAIEKVACWYDIDIGTITFAGLKDEDGITEQTIALPSKLNLEMSPTDPFVKSMLSLSYLGTGQTPMKIGELVGNAFRVVVRNLERNVVELLTREKKHCLNVINYYGLQRFGLPNQKKMTHWLGDALIKKRYGNAINLLAKQQSTLGKEAQSWQGDPEQFFLKQNSNVLAFFKSAYHAYCWNMALQQHLTSANPQNYTELNLSEIPYLFAKQSLDVNEFPAFIPYTRVIYDGKQFIDQALKRQTVVQLNITCGHGFEDELNPKRWACALDFFLPSGVYATMALNQFFYYLLKTNEAVCHAS